MTDREGRKAAFLGTAGWAEAQRRPLAGDASFRRYERLLQGNETAVLMDAPPEKEDVRPFWAVAQYLNARGLSAPHVSYGDTAQGFLLLEDLGDMVFTRLMAADPARERALYEAAVDLLVDLQREPPPAHLPYAKDGRYELSPYDKKALFEELFLFCDWYLPHLLGRRETGWRKELEIIWQPLFAELRRAREVLVLRDYHADNLVWLQEREGPARVGLLDFQDALIGHPAYDLVSLLQDARRDLSPGLECEMKERYLAAVPEGRGDIDPETFERHYQILGAQRNSKIIGIFTRLWRRDGKSQYLAMIPRVWAHLERNVAHPALAEYRAWLDDLVPAAQRRVPPGAEACGPS